MSALVVTNLMRKCQRTRKASSVGHGTRGPGLRESHSIGMAPHLPGASKPCSATLRERDLRGGSVLRFLGRRCQARAGAHGNGCCSIVGAPSEVCIRCARVGEKEGGAGIMKMRRAS